MKIKLNEIPENGRDYKITQKTAELNDDLKDLIQNNPYELELNIRPLNMKDFEVKGKMITTTQEICSLCGETFQFKVNSNIHEILIPIPEADKVQEKQTRSNHFSELTESGPSVTEYTADVFELGQLAHETIALAIPYSPRPEANDDGSCKVCLKMNVKETFVYDEEISIFEKAKEENNPFSILKGLKPN